MYEIDNEREITLNLKVFVSDLMHLGLSLLQLFFGFFFSSWLQSISGILQLFCVFLGKMNENVEQRKVKFQNIAKNLMSPFDKIFKLNIY